MRKISVILLLTECVIKRKICLLIIIHIIRLSLNKCLNNSFDAVVADAKNIYCIIYKYIETDLYV